MSKRNMTILVVVLVGGYLLYQMSQKGQGSQAGNGAGQNAPNGSGSQRRR